MKNYDDAPSADGLDAVDRELIEIIDEEGLPPTRDITHSLQLIDKPLSEIEAILARNGLGHLIIE